MTADGSLTLGRWLRDRARISPRAVAVDDVGGSHTTYAELDARAGAVAAALHRRGLRAGDRVAVLSGNRGDYVELFFACARAGLVLVPLSWRLAAAELAYQLADADVGLLLVEDNHADLGAKAVAGLETPPPPVAAFPLPAGAPLPADGSRPWADPPVRDDDPLLIVYTSGTTGHPKGAVLTHANCFWTNLSLDRTIGLRGDDVVLQVLPQFHVGGWNVQPLLAWWQGATVVLMRTFDPTAALELIESRRVTTMMGVPATYLFMAQAPRFASADLSSLRLAVVGGAPMPEPLLRTWTDRGVAIVQGYGLTEAAPNVLCVPPPDAVRKLGYAGLPYPYVDVALRDEHGKHLDGAGLGELLVRGPNVFAGYWRNPAATEEVLRDGWLATGDIAERDAEGYYRIRDRSKDVYISGGENVYPAEVESVLHEHPSVAEAAVVAVPDPRWGEAGVAVVALRPGAGPDTPEELLALCCARLARFKVPREVRVVPALPRSAMNKVLKRQLRASLSGEPT